MISIRNLRVDNSSLGNKMLLVDVAPVYAYENGMKTDKLSGYRYVVALPRHGLEKLSVKIDGKQLVSKPEGFVEVEFEDLVVTMYEMNGKTQLSAKASGVFTI